MGVMRSHRPWGNNGCYEVSWTLRKFSVLLHLSAALVLMDSAKQAAVCLFIAKREVYGFDFNSIRLL